jgi:hypothetical protein
MKKAPDIVVMAALDAPPRFRERQFPAAAFTAARVGIYADFTRLQHQKASEWKRLDDHAARFPEASVSRSIGRMVGSTAVDVFDALLVAGK